ncbi:MAG: thioredoxin domain-containing protein [Aggregatilineales bacterium]
MSKRRGRSSKRRSQKKQNSWIIYAVVIAIVGMVFVLIASNGGVPGSAPSVAQDRLDLDPILGEPDAPVTVIEYGAYACEACQAFHRSGAIEQILAEYGGQVNFSFRDFPVISPAYDRMAANVAQCVLDQGQNQFWAFHNALFTAVNAPRTSENELISLAGGIDGVDQNTLDECASNDTHLRTVVYDQNRAQDLGLRSTPSFVVNGQVIIGGNPTALRQAINAALGS